MQHQRLPPRQNIVEYKLKVKTKMREHRKHLKNSRSRCRSVMASMYFPQGGSSSLMAENVVKSPSFSASKEMPQLVAENHASAGSQQQPVEEVLNGRQRLLSFCQVREAMKNQVEPEDCKGTEIEDGKQGVEILPEEEEKVESQQQEENKPSENQLPAPEHVSVEDIPILKHDSRSESSCSDSDVMDDELKVNQAKYLKIQRSKFPVKRQTPRDAGIAKMLSNKQQLLQEEDTFYALHAISSPAQIVKQCQSDPELASHHDHGTQKLIHQSKEQLASSAANHQPHVHTVDEWMAEGILRHRFEPRKLQSVVDRLAPHARIPTGYMYPELHQVAVMPCELRQMLARKQMHLAQ